MDNSGVNTCKVSVIIPVWNPGAGIRRCVASLRGQTLRDIEMIFVDDCGTDGAMDVVRAAAAEDPRIRIITNAENVGPGISRNAGIDVARGEYLSFVDVDDYVSPNFLEVLYTKAKSEGLDTVKGRNVYELEDGTEASHADLNELIRKGLQEGKSLFTYQHQSAIYRRSLLEKYGIRYGASRRMQDDTFLLKVCHRAKCFGFEESAEYHFRERAGSLMHDMHPRTLERMLHAFSEQMDYIVENMPGEKNVTNYVSEQVVYLLRLVVYYGRNADCADSEYPFVHGVRSQLLRLPVADVERIKDESFTIKVLCNYEKALAQILFKLPWEKYKAEDYVDTLTDWVNFLVQHPDCVREAEKDVNRLLCEASYVCGMEDALRNSEELRLARNSLQHQLGRLAKLGFAWNDDVMLNFVKHQLNESNRLMVNQQQDTAQRMAEGLGHFLRLIPEIKSWAEKSRELEVRGAYDYGVALRAHLWGEFRTIPEYLQMLSNWRTFHVSHPECGMLFIKGYRKFLDDTRAFVLEQEQADAPTDALPELKDKLREEWHGLPFRVRAMRHVDYVKGIARRFRAKMQAVGAKKP